MTDPRTGTGTLLARSLYGFYGWAVFIVCVLFALLVVLLVPGEARRHRLAAASSRAIFILGFIPPDVRGIEHLPEGHSVVVANHASYADGFLLKGYLPARFSFVVKGEMRDVPIAHFLLRRAGSKFVERNKASGSARDARRIVKAARVGESLAFFPEGTFHREPGIGRFRPGAFVSAVKGDLPVVPVAISGTREMMPSGRTWPWPVRARIDILAPIMPGDPSHRNHRELAEKARQQILAVLDEPDLCKVTDENLNQD